MSDKQEKTPASHRPDGYIESAAGRTLERIAALLGSQREWDVENMEIISDMAHAAGFRHPGDPDNVAYYRAEADRLGMECYDADEDDQ